MLKLKFSDYKIECGTDEAGRGCLAGPVTAAAVILKNNFLNDDIDDSKKTNAAKKGKTYKRVKTLNKDKGHVVTEQVVTEQ